MCRDWRVIYLNRAGFRPDVISWLKNEVDHASRWEETGWGLPSIN